MLAATLLSWGQGEGYFLHTVSRGQSLYGIASMYHVSASEIVRLNPGCDSGLKAGAVLKIPQQGAASGERYHTIQAGETLYRLSVTYGIAVQRICDANPGLSSTNFRAGQVIVIPEVTAEETTAAVETPTAAVDTEQGTRNGYRCIHKVKKGDTIYSICRTYDISQEALIEANPELSDGILRKGQSVGIPYSNVSSEERTEAASAAAVIPTISTEVSPLDVSQPSSVHVAVILPFMLDQAESNDQKRMVEYYEGFLMAVDSLKRSGYSFDIQTFDARGAGNSMQSILSNPTMKKMDLIIGPSDAAQVKEVATFAQQHQIRMVIPFSSKNEEVFNNPYVYQINTPQSYLYSEVYDHFIRLFRNEKRLIFVDPQDGNHEKGEFIRGLKEELDSHRIPYQLLTLPAAEEESDDLSLLPLCSTEEENVFILTSGTSIALNKLLPYLKQLSLEAPEVKTHLFGYPEWQAYTNDYIDDFYKFDTYFYGSFYTNNLSKATHQFQNSFRKIYRRTIMNTYPKYAILGFDTGYYFLKGLSLYGKEFEENLSRVNVSPIQTSFKFERVNNWGGFVNRKVFFIHFTREHELIKMDFDR